MGEIIKEEKDFHTIVDNTVSGMPILVDSSITFIGKNNILYCEDNVKLVNSRISFKGNNSVIFLSSSMSSYQLVTDIFHNSVCYFGENSTLNGRLHISISEQKHFFVGDDCLISFDCWVRTADPHLIYDCTTGIRKNRSKSVFLGDHVWIGQHAMLLKGTRIGSGSFIGAMSLVSGKEVESNTCYAGNPAKKVAENVFFTKDSVHSYGKKKTKAHNLHKEDEFIFSFSETQALSFSSIEKSLDSRKDPQEKLQYLLDEIRNHDRKNRFYIKAAKPESILTKFKRKTKKLK